MKSCYAFLLLFLMTNAAAAQGPGQVLLFECQTELPVSAKKFMWVALSDLDRDVKVSIEERQVKVGLDGSIPPHLVLAALNNAGMGNFSPPLGTTRSATDSDNGTIPAFPVRLDTGDPVADDAAYTAAKQAWIALYPDAYERMNEQGERIDLSSTPAEHR